MAKINRNPFEVNSQAEKEARFEQITKGFEAFSEMFGKPGVESLMCRMNERGGLSVDDVRETMEGQATREELRNMVLNYLLSKKILGRKNGLEVLDIEKLNGINVKDLFNSSAKEGKRFHPYFKQDKMYAFYLVFKGLKVISKKDWEAGKHEPRELFYSPENESNAFDPNFIESQNFYLGAWQLSSINTNRSPKVNDKKREYPSEKSNLDLFETSIACLIFHPSFGHGKREKGHLMVKDPVTGEYVDMTGVWFRRMGFDLSVTTAEGTERLSSPLPFIEKYASTLLKKDLIRREDFIKVAGGKSEENRMERVGVPTTGSVMMRGVNYYLGKKLNKEAVKVVEISPTLGAILGKDHHGIFNQIKYTFKLYDRDDSRLSRQKGGKRGESEYAYAGGELTQVEPYDQEGFSKKREGEDDEAQESRIRSLLNYKRFVKSDQEWKKRTGVDTWGFSLSEKLELANVLDNKSADVARFIDMGNTFGADGLRFLINIPSDERALIKDALVGMGATEARALLQSYLKLVKLVGQTTDELSKSVLNEGNKLTEQEVQMLRQNILGRANHFLVSMARVQMGADKKEYLTQILHGLERSESDIVLFTSAFKAVSQERKVDIKDIRGLELERMSLADLSMDDKTQMLAISDENWKEIPGMSGFIHKTFSEKLNQRDARVNFYSLKKDGRILAFCRFDDRPDGSVYFGSVNVAPAFRGSAVGEAFLKQIFENAVDGRHVVANVYPTTPVASHYIERYGFVVTGLETVPSNKGKSEKGFVIERDGRPDNGYIGRNITFEEIKKYPLGRWSGDGVLMQKYDVQNKSVDMLEDIEKHLSQGSVISRFCVDPKDKRYRYVIFEKKRDAQEVRQAA